MVRGISTNIDHGTELGEVRKESLLVRLEAEIAANKLAPILHRLCVGWRSGEGRASGMVHG